MMTSIPVAMTAIPKRATKTPSRKLSAILSKANLEMTILPTLKRIPQLTCRDKIVYKQGLAGFDN